MFHTLVTLTVLSWVFPFLEYAQSSILIDIERPVAIESVVAVEGSTGVLPCDVLVSGNKDDVFLILWFKDNSSKPTYSVDVMGKPLSSASQWSDTSDLGGRSTFSLTQGQTALLIDNISEQDEGLYRCRVDYKNSPTKNFKIKLSVIVPPGEPVLLDYQGNPIQTHEVGPLEVGDDLYISCSVKGGFPSPRVTWWKEGTIYDDSYEKISKDVTVNRMKYTNLKREDLGTKFICQASNWNSSLPHSREVQLNLNLWPTSLEILEKPTYVSEGRERKITCRALGGFPPPRIQWWIGTRQINPDYQNAEYQGVSTSVLHYLPVMEDDGRYLTCRVILLGKLERVMEDTWEIKVLYKPHLDLRLGKSLDPDNLRTGNDVYFECSVKANPAPSKLIWFHNGEKLDSNPEAGILLSTQSLVLQGVTRNSTGEYHCQAVNSEGSSSSNSIFLNIMYSPVCSSTAVEMLYSELDTALTINCQVESFPQSVQYSWFFNNSDLEEWIGSQSYQQSGLTSALQFVPKSSKDYGNVYCFGKNSVGAMTKPCSFQILPTGKPSALSDCQVKNKTISSMRIECQEGFDGGLPTNFILQVYDAEQRELRVEASNKVPVFEVSHLDYAADLKIFIYAENMKGMSEAAILEESMPGSTSHMVQVTNSKAVKVSSSGPEGSEDSNLTIIISVASGGCIVCLSLLVVIILCGTKKRLAKKPTPGPMDRDIKQSYSVHAGSFDEYQGREEYEITPDVVPPQIYMYGEERYNTDFGSRTPLNRESAGTDQGKRHSVSVITTSVPLNRGYSGDTTHPEYSRKCGTLGPSRKYTNLHPYPLHHTCSRKKRVTIKEHSEAESNV